MRLATVSVLVPDYEAGLAFYRDALGFDVVEDTPLDAQSGKRWLVVSPGPRGSAVLLARADTDAQRAAVGQQGAGRVWLFLETDSLDTQRARMEAAGVAFEEAVREQRYGRVCVFSDPFGNRWDLIEPARVRTDTPALRVERSNDLPALSAVARATFLQSFAHLIPAGDIAKRAEEEDSQEGIAALLARNGVAWLARVVATDAPVGFALVCRPDLPSIEVGDTDLELKRLYVLHRFHGTGAGRDLLGQAVDHAKTRGAARLLLGVQADNSAVQWYARQGFTELGGRRFRVGDAWFDDRVMGLELR